MGAALGLLALAAAVLAGGAELFSDHAAGAGRRLGISGLAVGLLLAGAEPEELVTAVIAALRDQPGVAAGDAVGVNVTVLTLVMGSLAIAAPVRLGGDGARYLVAASGAGVAALLVMLDGVVGRAQGIALVVGYVAVVATIWRLERRPPAIGELHEMSADRSDRDAAGHALAAAVAGIGLMTIGGWVAVMGAERIIDRLAVDGSVVGLTVVALATSAELVALVPAAVRRGIPELAAAGIAGSVLYNATMTLGAAAIARPLAAAPVVVPAAVAAALTAVLAVVAWRRGSLGRGWGVALVAGYALHVLVLWT